MNRGTAAPSLADEFEQHILIGGVQQRGMIWEPADKSPGSRVRDWETIRGKLRATMPARGLPRLFITQNCSDQLRTLQALPRDPRKPDDSPEKTEDHLPDTLRYILGKRHEPGVSFSRRWVA